MAANPIVHFEIGGRDDDRLRTFYAAMFDWEIQPAGPDYWMVQPEDGGIGGGLMRTREGMPAYVTVYGAVDDLAASLEKAAELGGKTIVEPTDLQGIGAFAMFQDPDGNVIGLFREPTTSS